MSDYINPVETALKAAGSAFKGYDEAAVVGKENLDALMASGNVLAKASSTIRLMDRARVEASAKAAVGG